MKNPTLTLTHSEATRERLLSFIHQNQTAYIGIKIAALLLTLEGQRPGWICEILGMSRQTLNVFDASGKRTGVDGSGTFQETWSSCSSDPQDTSNITRPSGEVSVGVRAESGAMGWSHAGCTPEAAVWDNAEGSPGPGVDASIGV